MVEYMAHSNKMKLCSVCSGRRLLSFLLLILLIIGLASCAGKTRTQELLVKDYVTMTDDDLLLHYYQLEDQIVADERAFDDSSVSFGIGTGFFGSGSHLGGGVGMSTGTGSRYTATELRDRRNVVRLELRKRGVNP